MNQILICDTAAIGGRGGRRRRRRSLARMRKGERGRMWGWDSTNLIPIFPPKLRFIKAIKLLILCILLVILGHLSKPVPPKKGSNAVTTEKVYVGMQDIPRHERKEAE